MTNRATTITALLLMTLAAACGQTSTPTQTNLGTPTPPNPETGPNAPQGQAVRFDDALLSEDGSNLTLKFVGGREYDPRDPCSTHYFGWANEVDRTLNAKIVDDTPPFPGDGSQVVCDSAGHFRTITIHLEQPFTGARIHDLAGYDHFVRRPIGVAEIKVPAGWTALDEGDVEESPTGRWRQSWTKGEAGEGGKGRIDLYQAFGGPASVSGGEEIREVKVGDRSATLYRQGAVGELVLVWSLGGDGLALVVNEADFPVEAAIKLAETATIP